MESIPIADFKKALVKLFDEIYAGPRDYKMTWIVSNEPDAGLFGMLRTVTATQASVTLASGQSVASHVEHLRWSLVVMCQYYRDIDPKPNWEESWSVHEVDETQWDQLRAELENEYKTLRQLFETRTDWSDPVFFTGTMAIVPHAAYHLGALRQMVAAAKAA